MTSSVTLAVVLERSRQLGLLGPGSVEAHLEHAEGFVRLARGATSVLDLGSGGGIPGLVLAVELPETRLTLLDAGERRIAFLRDSVRQLGCDDRVVTVLGRAEQLARDDELREQFDVVTARSFGAPAVTAECAAGFLHLGGRLLVSEPEGSADRWPARQLLGLGLAPVGRHEFERSTIQELERVAVGIDAVPRRTGVPARRPLF